MKANVVYIRVDIILFLEALSGELKLYVHSIVQVAVVVHCGIVTPVYGIVICWCRDVLNEYEGSDVFRLDLDWLGLKRCC